MAINIFPARRLRSWRRNNDGPEHFQNDDKDDDKHDECQDLCRAEHKPALILLIEAHQTAKRSRHADFVVCHANRMVKKYKKVSMFVPRSVEREMRR